MSQPWDGKHVSKKIKSRAEKLKKMMKDKFSIDISTEDERLSTVFNRIFSIDNISCYFFLILKEYFKNTWLNKNKIH